MSRSIGVCPDDSSRPKIIVKRESGVDDTQPGMRVRIFSVSLLTPLFGGGTVAGENDPVKYIRESSVRGQLRFWWRATRGACCKDEGELWEAESEVWGAPDCPSPVSIKVTVTNEGESVSCATYPNGRRTVQFKNGYPGYALFPFAGDAGQDDTAKDARIGICFDLEVTYPRILESDVNAAIWAWLNFGGIGARTRRGCGALFCENVQPELLGMVPLGTNQFAEWFKGRLKAFQIQAALTNPVRPWPTLPRCYGFCATTKSPLNAWERAVNVMRNFRQGPGDGRAKGVPKKGESYTRPGRSYWPEAESVRESVCAQKKLRTRPTHSSGNWHPKDKDIPTVFFPRAELGMPIIFELRNETLNNSGRRPFLAPCLEPQNSNRMASPVILRPIQFADGQIAPMAAVLVAPAPEQAVLKHGKNDLTKDVEIESSHIRSRGLSSYSNSPLVKSPSGSALEAFIAYADSKGFSGIGVEITE